MIVVAIEGIAVGIVGLLAAGVHLGFELWLAWLNWR